MWTSHKYVEDSLKMEVRVKRRKYTNNTMITIRDKIKTGGKMGIIHIIVSVVISFLMIIQPETESDESVIIWNVMVFNLPVFLDFAHTFDKVPAEKIGKPFKYLIYISIVGLLLSVVFSLIGIGVICLYPDYKSVHNVVYIINCVKKFLKLSILVNPTGVLSDYMCSILIEEHRIETKVEVSQCEGVAN